MSIYNISPKYLLSESDVEQKVIYPLLTNADPMGLGYDSTEIQTKISLQKLVIDKGAKSFTYFPDYIVTVDGIPSIVIEAKKPEEDLDEAFRQAALYAAELNRKFEKNVNPCQLIIACDGQELYAGYWDSVKPSFKIKTESWLVTEQDFAGFCNVFGKLNLERNVESIKKIIRKKAQFKKPLNLIGGKYFQNRITNNTFGESISTKYRHLFNPNEEAERIDVVKNAYVRITKHDSHVAPIDRLIRKKILPNIAESTEIEDNTAPKALLDKLANAHDYNNQVLLLVGSVGSGKSTFGTYLKEVAIEKHIVNQLSWVTLDLNNAPVSSEEIYTWIKKGIIRQIQNINNGYDFEKLEVIQLLYEQQINSLKKGVLAILDEGSDKYKEILVLKILEYQTNLDLTLEAYISQFVHKQRKELIIVLDNCDKRNLEEQLLMFEVANWIKDSIKAMVFLPLRDTTFDHFRKEKPLDTVIKDLIFRITPPSLEKVLYSRIKYAARLSEKRSDNFYYLPNGFKVSYPAKDELYYLKSILKSLFQDSFFKWLISGITGSDIRVGLEIFLDFCKSGHISESDILAIKSTQGEHSIKNHIITNVFLRGNRLYYSDSEARIKNLFYSDPSDSLPDPFVRIAILKWLKDNFKIKGPSGIMGFHFAESLIGHLISNGHERKRIESELSSLMRHSLIINESQNTHKVDLKDLIAINTPGIIHLELINNSNYLSACSEDVWYNVVQTAENISKNMSGEGEYAHLSLQSTKADALELIKYLISYYDKHFSPYSEYLNDSESFLASFKLIKESVESIKFRENTSSDKFQIGAMLNAKIINIKSVGLIVQLENSEVTALIHKNKIDDKDFENTFKLEEPVKVKVTSFLPRERKYTFKIIKEN